MRVLLFMPEGAGRLLAAPLEDRGVYVELCHEPARGQEICEFEDVRLVVVHQHTEGWDAVMRAADCAGLLRYLVRAAGAPSETPYADVLFTAPLGLAEFLVCFDRDFPAVSAEEAPADLTQTADLSVWSEAIEVRAAAVLAELRHDLDGLGEELRRVVGGRVAPLAVSEHVRSMYVAASTCGRATLARELETVELLLRRWDREQSPERRRLAAAALGQAFHRARDVGRAETDSWVPGPPGGALAGEPSRILYLGGQSPPFEGSKAPGISLLRVDDLPALLRRAPGARGVLLDVNELGLEAALQATRALREAGAERVGLLGASPSFDQRIAAAKAGACCYFEGRLTRDLFEVLADRLAPPARPSQPKVLVVDGEAEGLARLCERVGGWGLSAIGLEDPRKIFEALDRHNPDLLLMDADPAGFDGLEMLRVVRGSQSWSELPVISRVRGEGLAAAALAAGADDVVSVDTPAGELRARLERELERRFAQARRTDRDPLTGLFNRRALNRMAAMRLAEARRADAPLSIAVIDLDRFKHVNDNHGHLAGDRVLVALGRLLTESLRAEDVYGRWGGEEFVVGLRALGPLEAREVIQRLLTRFRDEVFEGEGGAPFRVTFSAGVASFPEDGAELEPLFEAADRRLYRAKRRGRNRIEVRAQRGHSGGALPFTAVGSGPESPAR